MTVSVKQLVYPFIKAGVIHDDYALSLKAQGQRIFAPVVEYFAIDIFLERIQRKQQFFIQGTDDIGTLFCLSVVAVKTRFTTYRCITVKSYGLRFKAALIHMSNGKALSNLAVLTEQDFGCSKFFLLIPRRFKAASMPDLLHPKRCACSYI